MVVEDGVRWSTPLIGIVDNSTVSEMSLDFHSSIYFTSTLTSGQYSRAAMPHKSAQAAPVTTSTRITQSVQAGKVYLVARHGSPPRELGPRRRDSRDRSLTPGIGPAAVLEVRIGKDGVNEAYVSFVGKDKRLDTWVPETDVGQEAETESTVGGPSQEALVAVSRSAHTQNKPPTLT